ncbi:MAG: PAS domain-containing protein [Bacteroidetes bacterium]|nr:PAS domain-containing protein [Bacteroidota bacterium]
MKIKTKLTLSVGLLFFMIALLAAIGAKQVNSLAADSKNILQDNYNTLDYSRNMLKSLDGMHSENNALGIFESNLKKQAENITEVGEAEFTNSLAAHFEQLKANHFDTVAAEKIRKDINDIMKLNMDAIQRKSNIAANTARNATIWITITGTLCFLIAFSLLVNLPGSIANPIHELTGSIKAIAAKNYSQRVHFKKGSEFGELADSFNIMAQKLEEYNNSNLAKLMMEKKRIETLINNMHDPVIGLDEKGMVLFANEEALKIAGLKKEEVTGRSAQELSVHNDLIRSLLQEISGNENSVARVEKKPLKIYADGKESYFEREIVNISIVPTGEQDSRVIGHVIVLRNVTPYKELDFAKTNFIATVSHELKTPISAIKMSVQLLENEQIGKTNEEQKNLIESIKEDATRLLKITGELLNMTQVESGNIQLGIIPSDPLEIINYAVNANKIIAEQKNVRLEISADNNLPKVLADSEKTAWVLTNLISNAVRYSYDNSSVQISIKSDSSKIYFVVKDTGQGIAPQYKEKIFDRYFRIPGSQKEGTGLGLSISKEFIEAQGGQISVESDFGAGSVFAVALNKA